MSDVVCPHCKTKGPDVEGWFIYEMPRGNETPWTCVGCKQDYWITHVVTLTVSVSKTRPY